MIIVLDQYQTPFIDPSYRHSTIHLFLPYVHSSLILSFHHIDTLFSYLCNCRQADVVLTSRADAFYHHPPITLSTPSQPTLFTPHYLPPCRQADVVLTSRADAFYRSKCFYDEALRISTRIYGNQHANTTICEQVNFLSCPIVVICLLSHG